jgi:hypothetical protein
VVLILKKNKARLNESGKTDAEMEKTVLCGSEGVRLKKIQKIIILKSYFVFRFCVFEFTIKYFFYFYDPHTQ